MKKRTVFLYGQSLLLAGVAASLQKCPGLQVTHATTWAEASQLLAEQVPDVLIFDMTNANETHILPLLLKNPGLLLIGLDPEHNRAVLLGGQETRALTLEGLGDIVQGRSGHAETHGHGYWRRDEPKRG